MTFNRDGQLARYCYGRSVPDETDLCSLFWRGVWHTVNLVAGGAALGVGVSLVLMLALTSTPSDWMALLVILGFLVALVGLVILVVFLLAPDGAALPRRIKARWNEAEVVLFLKGRYCPHVSFRDAEDRE